jgi:SAM-dependent methyltransferase
MGHFQRRLARKAIGLLDPRPDERILDVGCGRGWTTHEIARRGAHALGLDLVPEHVEEAKRRFGLHPGVRYAVADAAALGSHLRGLLPEGGPVDGILCLEAAFQFGAKGRRAFLAEALRCLRPGGRLVLVDFAWRTNRPEEIGDLDAGGYVRDAWQFEEFEPLERYRAEASALGFVERSVLDWSPFVIDRFQAVCSLLVALAKHRVPRFLLCCLRPGLFRLGPEDWSTLPPLMAAHDRVRARTRYVAMALEKSRRSGASASGAGARPA